MANTEFYIVRYNPGELVKEKRTGSKININGIIFGTYKEDDIFNNWQLADLETGYCVQTGDTKTKTISDFKARFIKYKTKFNNAKEKAKIELAKNNIAFPVN